MLLILFNRFLLLCERTVPSVSFLTIFLHLELFKQILLLAFPNTGGYPNCTWKLIQKLFGASVLELCVFSASCG